jgi:hypothetical protein
MTRLSISLAALVVAAGAALAQQKGGEEKSSPQMQGGPATQSPQKNEAQPGAERVPGKAGKSAAEKSVEPKDKASKGTAEKAEPKDKGGAQKSTEPKEKGAKGTAEKAQPKDKGTAQKSPQPQDKGTAEKAQPQDKGGTAEKARDPNRGTARKGREPGQEGTKGAAQRGSTERVQVTSEQRTNISQTLTKERQVNRVTNVNFSINVGTRVPRSVRLVALPASVIAIVPEYRSYRYFVAEDRICIVEPATYEIVEVIEVSDRTASRPGGSTHRLVLTEEEKEIILSEVDMRDGSTLGLGALTEGAEVPQRAELLEFAETVVEKVPKVKGYRYIAADNRIAIVEPQDQKVALVIEQRR